MEHLELSIRIDTFKKDFERLLQDLIEEVERLEGENDGLVYEVNRLQETNEDLSDDCATLQDQVDALKEILAEQ